MANPSDSPPNTSTSVIPAFLNSEPSAMTRTALAATISGVGRKIGGTLASRTYSSHAIRNTPNAMSGSQRPRRGRGRASAAGLGDLMVDHGSCIDHCPDWQEGGDASFKGAGMEN